MSGRSKISTNLVAVVAALLMSSVTIGAAVGPAQAQASVYPVTNAIQKNLNA